MTTTPSIRPDANAAPRKTVRFQAKDVRVPAPAELLLQLFGDVLIEGQIIDRSSGGSSEEFFAVHVEGAKSPVLINVNRVQESPDS